MESPADLKQRGFEGKTPWSWHWADSAIFQSHNKDGAEEVPEKSPAG
jgi:hypothetical protein